MTTQDLVCHVKLFEKITKPTSTSIDFSSVFNFLLLYRIYLLIYTCL